MTTILTADLIRAGRALLGWSQTDLAAKSGVTQKTLSDIESGKKTSTAKTNERLRKIFEEAGLQFIASNTESSAVEGAGVRWRPKLNALQIKVL